MRWLDELRNPALKCARVGHKPGVGYREGYRKPREIFSRYVCLKVRDERPVCLRCPAASEEWEVVSEHGFTGYSWPASQADAFRREGFYWTAEGTTS